VHRYLALRLDYPSAIKFGEIRKGGKKALKMKGENERKGGKFLLQIPALGFETREKKKRGENKKRKKEEGGE